MKYGKIIVLSLMVLTLLFLVGCSNSAETDAQIATLTSENADLSSQVQSLTSDLASKDAQLMSYSSTEEANYLILKLSSNFASMSNYAGILETYYQFYNDGTVFDSNADGLVNSYYDRYVSSKNSVASVSSSLANLVSSNSELAGLTFSSEGTYQDLVDDIVDNGGLSEEYSHDESYWLEMMN